MDDKNLVNETQKTRLKVDFAEWSRPETDAGKRALETRLSELEPDPETCKHEYEGFTQPGTVHGPTEYFSTCKHCGSDNPGD